MDIHSGINLGENLQKPLKYSTYCNVVDLKMPVISTNVMCSITVPCSLGRHLSL